jgi:hypothetical protein
MGYSIASAGRERCDFVRADEEDWTILRDYLHCLKWMRYVVRIICVDLLRAL